ncbi:MAG: preprotein translocase subunit SecE [Cyanobacteria bacterium M_surface_10_m1_298]|nr:preprotein translocase subunit SecE [Cyanobacteria bacterium M_surface_10_m1_298]
MESSSVESQTEPQANPDASLTAEPVKGGFVADTLAELRKVVWPSRQQLFGESVAVILMVTISAFAIAAVDRFYSWGSSQVFR